MLKALKRLLGKKEETPLVELTGFRHGLITFRSEEPLSLKALTVKTTTPEGSFRTNVDIQSYDPGSGEYLAKVKPTDKTLESLDIDLSKIASVHRVLKVSSPSLPHYVGLTEELSPHGLRLSTTERLNVGEEIDLKIELDVPNLGKLKATAEVEWSAYKSDDTCHSGLRFRNMGTDQIGKLARYIRVVRGG